MRRDYERRTRRRGKVRSRIAAYREIRSRRPGRRIPRAVVPSFFTVMNLFSGFLAIIQVHEGNFIAAAWLIVLAGFFDLLDGFMARIARATSEFGVELDSLCDVVSFGVAPAFLIYAFGLSAIGMPGVVLASLPAICGAVRLARFNITFEGEKKDYFQGMPIPVQAITVVAFILTFSRPENVFGIDAAQPGVLIPLVVLLSALMISTVKFDSVPKITPRAIRAEPWKMLSILIAIILIIFLREVGLLISIAGYIFFSLGRAMYYAVMAVWTATGEYAERPEEESDLYYPE